VVVTLLVFAVALVCIAVLTVTARTVHHRAHAQSAADAVALAAAHDGAPAADRVAHANDATIVRLVDDDDTVTVTVSRGGVQASARASRGECRGSCPSIP
jgi:hypothetical protein